MGKNNDDLRRSRIELESCVISRQKWETQMITTTLTSLVTKNQHRLWHLRGTGIRVPEMVRLTYLARSAEGERR